MNTYTYVANVSDLVSDVLQDTIISRTLHATKDVRVVLFGLAAGQELSEHTVSHPAILQVIHGEGRLTLGDEALPATAGTWVYLPPHLRHSLVAKTPLVMLLLLIKTEKARRSDGSNI